MQAALSPASDHSPAIVFTTVLASAFVLVNTHCAGQTKRSINGNLSRRHNQASRQCMYGEASMASKVFGGARTSLTPGT